MKNIVLVGLDTMVGNCDNCRCPSKQGEVMVHLAASDNRYQLEGGIPPIRHLYCKSCWNKLVERAGNSTWPDSDRLGVSAPHGRHTRRWFVLKGSVVDPLERFRDSATHCKEGVKP